MDDNPIDKFFDENVKPSFKTFEWPDEHIEALRGAFYLGVFFTLNQDEDTYVELSLLIDEFMKRKTKPDH